MLVTDRMSSLTSNYMKEFFATFNMNIVFVGVGHHASNVSEASIGAYSKMLCKRLATKPRQWPKWVEIITYAYNCLVHSETKISPFYAVFLKESNASSIKMDIDQRNLHSEQYVAEMKERADLVRNFIVDKRLKDQELKLIRSKRKDLIERFSKFDLAWLFLPDSKAISRKFSAQFLGPVIVIAALGARGRLLIVADPIRLDIKPVIIARERLRKFVFTTGQNPQGEILTASTADKLFTMIRNTDEHKKLSEEWRDILDYWFHRFRKMGPFETIPSEQPPPNDV